MKSLNGAAVVAAWSALAAGGAAHAQEAVFVTLPLGDLANTRLESPPNSGYSAPLEQFDPLVLNGIPFAHSNDAWAWNCHLAAIGGHPTSLILEIGGLQADAIFTQLNTYWGAIDNTVGLIEIHLDDGSVRQFELVGNYNIRDYLNAFHANELTAPNAAPAFEWSNRRMDIQAWSLSDPQDQGVMSIHIHDFGEIYVSRLVLGGVTLAFSSDCNGDGIVDYGQILDGTFADANANGVPDCCDDGVSCDPCLGDVNFDGIVNGADISVLLGFWGLNGKPVAADINKDGQVDGTDLANVLGSWGECP